MSTTPKPSTSDWDVLPDDPFFYGFRYVTRRTHDGKPVLVQKPLTAEDVLHPQEGDYITQGDSHNIDCTYLRNVLTVRMAPLPDPKVLSDCLISLGVKGLRKVCSDIAAFTNVRRRKVWKSFSVRKEKARWVLVGEVTSPSTRDKDLNVKPDIYFKAGVPICFIVDEVSVDDEGRHLRLIGYERGPRGYREIPLSADGRLWLEPVQLWLGVEGGRVVCYDAEGNEIEDYEGMDEARREAEAGKEAAEVRADAAEEARDAEKARADAAEAARDAEKARAEAARKAERERARTVRKAEKERADAAETARDAEKARADVAEAAQKAEKERADAAEKRLRRLEAELRRRRKR